VEANFQRIQKSYKTQFDIAKCYYTIVFGLNNLHVTKNELNLVAFSAVMGTISTPPVRKQFCEEFDIPTGSMYNMVSKLQKQQILYKDQENKIRVNPVILPDFTRPDLLLIIKMNKDENNTGD